MERRKVREEHRQLYENMRSEKDEAVAKLIEEHLACSERLSLKEMKKLEEEEKRREELKGYRYGEDEQKRA
jgi:DNA-binding FadR family transcriptional regulator